MIDQKEAVKLMEKLQRLTDKRMRIESKAAIIISQLRSVKQAGGHDVQDFIKKQGFSEIPLEGGDSYGNDTNRNDPVPNRFEGDF